LPSACITNTSKDDYIERFIQLELLIYSTFIVKFNAFIAFNPLTVKSFYQIITKHVT
jgi:hypothetical protein